MNNIDYKMNSVYSFVVIVLLVVVAKGDIKSPTPLETRLLSLVKKWQVGDVKSVPFSFPSMESVKVAPISGNFNQKGIKLSYSTSEMKLSGLKNFSIDELTASENDLKASVTVTFPILTLIAEHYDLNGRAFFIYPLKGSGKMTVHFQNVRLLVAVQLASNNNFTKIDNLKIEFSVHKLEANLEHSTWPINKVLSSQGADLLASKHDEIVNSVRDYVIQRANEYLRGVTPSQLLKKLEIQD